MELLISAKCTVLGIEIWRGSDSRFSLDSLDGWHSNAQKAATPNVDALRYLKEVAAGPEDLFTVQFSDDPA